MAQTELLAPAADTQCAIRAIQCGADAVYIGAPQFGARKTAGNSIADIAVAVEFAHKYFAKVYVALNTILTDDEIEQAHRIIHELYSIGVDGVIIQDMGILELDLPPIPLIASTQIHNNSVEKIKFLENCGFKRAILARELQLPEIKDIRSAVNMEIECFIHGSLCVGLSGQCYMSYAIGGRSGNRGECAQPCRKKYSLADSGGKIISHPRYLLSLKDLNLSDYLEYLISAGVNSFKIEGRLRDINYITNVVSYYRRKIDGLIDGTPVKKTSSGKVFIDFTPDLRKTFNRGYTSYFINGRSDDITSMDTPKSIGEPVGVAGKLYGSWFSLKNPADIHNGDGICYFNDESELEGSVINKVDGEKIYPAKIRSIRQDSVIYRNLDREFLKKLKTAKIERKIPVDFFVSDCEEGITVTAKDSDGITAQKNYPAVLGLSTDPKSMSETIIRQFSKLGDTEFIAGNINIGLSQVYFFQIRLLNEIRRDIIEVLRKNRKSFFNNKTASPIEKNNFPYISQEIGFEGNVLNEKARCFYIRHGVTKIEPAAESGLDMAGKKVMTTGHCLKYQFGLCPKYAADNKNSGFKEPFYLIDELGKKYRLNFDCKNCRMEIIF